MIPSAEAARATVSAARPSSTVFDGRIGTIWIAAIVAVGAALRLYGLGAKSLGLDEVIGSNASKFNSFGALIAWVKADIDQMPAFSSITWLLRGFGDSEVVMRLPAAVAGILAIVAVYLLGKRLFDGQVALIAAVLMSISPFAEWYSQEARAYTLLMLVTTMQILFAYRARRDGKWLDWLGLTLFSILNLYTHYLALLPTAAVYAYLGLSALSDRHDRQAALREGARAVGSAALVALAYSPWLHALSAFLRSGSKGFARYGTDGHVTASQAISLVEGLGFHGLLMIPLAVGLIALSARLARAADGSSLLIASFALPIVALAVRLRGSVLYLDQRYLTFLVPPMIVFTAVGAKETAWFLASAAGRWRPQWKSPETPAALLIIGVLVASTIPALAAVVTEPKSSFRELAAYVTRSTPHGSVVLALGRYPDFSVIGLSHYFSETGSSVSVLDATHLSQPARDQLANDRSQAWGVTFQPTENEVVTAVNRGLTVDTSFTQMLLVRTDPALSAAEQIRILIAWDGT